MTVETSSEQRNRRFYRENPPLIGLWLLITDDDGNIFVIENGESKYASQKVVGQLNSPAESVEPEDDRKYKEKTLPRAIEQEVGSINGLNLESVRLRGLIELTGIDYPSPIFALGVEIKTSQENVHYNPKNADNKDTGVIPKATWVPLTEVDHRTFAIEGKEVPVYRTPMRELVQNVIRARTEGDGKYLVFQRVSTSISKQLVETLKRNSGSNP